MHLLVSVGVRIAVKATDGCKHVARLRCSLPVPTLALEECRVRLRTAILHHKVCGNG